MKDQVLVKSIHQACLSYAASANGRLPTPGLIAPLADPRTGFTFPGLAREDHAVNHTRCLYSALIMHDYFGPGMIVGPTEVNDVIVVHDDYDYDAYDPVARRYWDDGLRADLDGDVCHTSYAHLALCGARHDAQWADTQHSGAVMFSTRGTALGATSGPAYAASPTLLLHGPEREWVGNVCYADNHAETTNSFFPTLVTYAPLGGSEEVKDNIFDAEFDDLGPSRLASGDAFLVICTSASADGERCAPVWDVLLD